MKPNPETNSPQFWQIYRGCLNGPKQTNIQHKIADRRNGRFRATYIDLDNLTVGKGELTLTSPDKTLYAMGLKTVDGLAHIRSDAA